MAASETTNKNPLDSLPDTLDICPCQSCQGTGQVRGVFSAMECDVCDGLGYTDTSGHWLDTRLSAIVARHRVKWLVALEQKQAAAEKSLVPVQLWLKGWRKTKDGRLYKPGGPNTVLD